MFSLCRQLIFDCSHPTLCFSPLQPLTHPGIWQSFGMAWVGLHLDLVLGSEVVVVTATNVKDAVARHMYQITSGNEGSSFSINTSTGVSVFFSSFCFGNVLLFGSRVLAYFFPCIPGCAWFGHWKWKQLT